MSKCDACEATTGARYFYRYIDQAAQLCWRCFSFYMAKEVDVSYITALEPKHEQTFF